MLYIPRDGGPENLVSSKAVVTSYGAKRLKATLRSAEKALRSCLFGLNGCRLIIFRQGLYPIGGTQDHGMVSGREFVVGFLTVQKLRGSDYGAERIADP
jgi:hypothetical protein